jgi:hypothetical protein
VLLLLLVVLLLLVLLLLLLLLLLPQAYWLGLQAAIRLARTDLSVCLPASLSTVSPCTH